MSLRISGKHMDIGDAFRTRIESRIGDAIGKYFDGGFSGHVTVDKSGSRFVSDCRVRLDTGASLQASAEAQEPVAAFDGAAEKLENRLRRYKRRLRTHHAPVPGENAVDVAYRVMAPLADEEEVPADFAPTIVAETTVALKSMSVAVAVMELDTKDSPVYVFRNATNDRVNIVYRRPDGNIGWIDTSATSAAR